MEMQRRFVKRELSWVQPKYMRRVRTASASTAELDLGLCSPISENGIPACCSASFDLLLFGPPRSLSPGASHRHKCRRRDCSLSLSPTYTPSSTRNHAHIFDSHPSSHVLMCPPSRTQSRL
eukprot:6195514-Pleurochrysis_carterae.AAC.1